LYEIIQINISLSADGRKVNAAGIFKLFLLVYIITPLYYEKQVFAITGLA